MEPELDHAEIAVSTDKGYILVKPPPGINFWTILETIGKLIPLCEFVDKNDLWIFQDGRVNLTFQDLQVTKDFGVTHYPKGTDRKKTAIVVGTYFQRSLAES